MQDIDMIKPYLEQELEVLKEALNKLVAVAVEHNSIDDQVEMIMAFIAMLYHDPGRLALFLSTTIMMLAEERSKDNENSKH